LSAGIVNKGPETSSPLKDNPKISIHSQSISLGSGWSFTKTYSDTSFADPQKATVVSSPKYIGVKLGNKVYWTFVLLVFFMILFVTMVYGPIAAFLVEMFPTKIRYTSMSLPYHIGNGVFGRLVLFIGLLLTTTYDPDPFAGLW